MNLLFQREELLVRGQITKSAVCAYGDSIRYNRFNHYKKHTIFQRGGQYFRDAS